MAIALGVEMLDCILNGILDLLDICAEVLFFEFASLCLGADCVFFETFGIIAALFKIRVTVFGDDASL